jgi:lysozyme family protein
MTSPATTIINYSAQRLKFLQGLSTWPTFGKGWERRVNEVKAAALSM